MPTAHMAIWTELESKCDSVKVNYRRRESECVCVHLSVYAHVAHVHMGTSVSMRRSLCVCL